MAIIIGQAYSHYCAMKDFFINSMSASSYDFGDVEDRRPENAKPYGCGDRQFIISKPNKEILDKYGISVNTYYAIAYFLKDRLSFGECSYCL